MVVVVVVVVILSLTSIYFPLNFRPQLAGSFWYWYTAVHIYDYNWMWRHESSRHLFFVSTTKTRLETVGGPEGTCVDLFRFDACLTAVTNTGDCQAGKRIFFITLSMSMFFFRGLQQGVQDFGPHTYWRCLLGLKYILPRCSKQWGYSR